MAQPSKHRGSTGTALTGCKAVVADTHDGTVCVAHRESVVRPS
jgi:hypothetical protein